MSVVASLALASELDISEKISFLVARGGVGVNSRLFAHPLITRAIKKNPEIIDFLFNVPPV